MIRQICPHCLRTVELPDSTAGTVADCPRCRELIPVPAAYVPSVDPNAGPAAPPPGYRPSPDPNLERSAVKPSSDPITLDRVDRTPPPAGRASPWSASAAYRPDSAPSGYEKTAALVLTPQGLAWIPAGCLTFIFLLTFFSWAGSYPGGVHLYSQTAWESMVKGYSVNPLPDVTADAADIDAKMRTSWWMWPYMLVLLVTLATAWFERLVLRNTDPEQLPEPVREYWPQRFAILSTATGVLLLLLLFQSAVGFGLETAIRHHVYGEFALREANANSEPERQKVEVNRAKTLNGYDLRMTTARQLALAANVVALAAFLGRWWLDRRGSDAAQPRALVQY
ncbi:MAG TPA: hypothetical protein VFG68_08105 [Fimbriiglobus sp.]|nr:hypothetical protein [Fimbriiglobus sp.]